MPVNRKARRTFMLILWLIRHHLHMYQRCECEINSLSFPVIHPNVKLWQKKKKEKNLEIATIRRQETYVGPLKLAWWPRIIIWFSVHRRQTLFLSLPQWNSDEQKPRHLHLKEVFVSIFLPSAYTSFQFYMHFKGKIFNMDHQYHHHYRHLPQMY